MAVQELRKEISRNADKAAEAVDAEAKAQARRIAAEASEQAKALLEKAEAEGQALAEEESRKVSSARVRAKHLEAQARERVLAKAFAALKSETAKLPSKKKEYEKLFSYLAQKALDDVGKDAVLSCRSADAPMAKKLASKVETIDCMGGVRAVSKDGTVIVDYTLDALLEDHAEDLRAALFKELFE